MTSLPFHPFRFGVINEQMGDPAAWGEKARQIEAAGYATFLLRDHFVPDFFGDQLAPLIGLLAAATATQTLRVGTMVLCNDYRHPVMVAKEAATLDQLSGGRFELGLGAGWLQSEYAQAGLPFDAPGVRVSRLAEAIRVLKGLFADGPLHFAGEHYTINGIDGYPKPYQRPHPPLLIGAGSKRMLMLAGREADIVGLLTTSVRTGTLIADPTERLADSVLEKLAWIRDGAGPRFPQLELSLIIDFHITPDRRGVAEQLIGERQWQGITVEQVLAMPAIFIGTVAEIIEEFYRRREQYGFSYYVVNDEAMTRFAPIAAALRGR
jgi:probable F420-dependent oxidoreductase